MLHLHLLELTLKLLVLLNLGGVLVVDTVQVLDDFGVLCFHLRHFVPPLLAFLVFLLLQHFTLLLDTLFLKLKHLDFIVDMASFDIAELELILNLVDAITAISSINVVLTSRNIICALHLVLLENNSLRSERLLLHSLFIFLIVAAIALDVLVVGQLLSRWSVALSLSFHAAIVSTGIGPSERLLSIVVPCQRLISCHSHCSCSLL